LTLLGAALLEFFADSYILNARAIARLFHSANAESSTKLHKGVSPDSGGLSRLRVALWVKWGEGASARASPKRTGGRVVALPHAGLVMVACERRGRQLGRLYSREEGLLTRSSLLFSSEAAATTCNCHYCFHFLDVELRCWGFGSTTMGGPVV
jgi:hypothetical protein